MLNERIGRALRKVRTQAGLTQAQVADALSVTQAQVGKYESGKSVITVSQVYHYAFACKTTAASLFVAIDNEVLKGD